MTYTNLKKYPAERRREHERGESSRSR
jgi:hypothetical protein